MGVLVKVGLVWAGLLYVGSGGLLVGLVFGFVMVVWGVYVVLWCLLSWVLRVVILRVLVLIVLAFVSVLCRGNYLCLVGF